jgi:predicted small lipoprotein YifL
MKKSSATSVVCDRVAVLAVSACPEEGARRRLLGELMAGTALCLLMGCGQKGALYLPGPPATQAASPVVGASAPVQPRPVTPVAPPTR